jgi:hypothetical protein
MHQCNEPSQAPGLTFSQLWLIAMWQLSNWSEVVHIGSLGDDLVDQA